jgi:predicted nucleotidyltransferase
MDKKLGTIKRNVKKVLAAERINVKSMILFGSMARGDYNKFSDYDLLIVIPKEISIKDKIRISTEIRNKLADDYIDADIIIKSEGEVEYCQKMIGTVTREALKEGVTI